MNIISPRPLWALILCTSTQPLTLQAQIVTDGSLGPQVELSGPDMTIGAELGQTHGNNLFHSFQRFGIPTDHSATFTGPDQIRNVIGRVTGGEVSEIDGQLRSTVGQADVYLINPAGVVMGPNATVDVPASLHVSTADELRFDDGSRFSARDPGGSTLTMAAPEAFGFLGRQTPGDVTLNGTRLEVGAGQTLGLSGGDLAIRGRDEQSAQLTAPGGRLRLDAVGAVETEVSLSAPAPMMDHGYQGTVDVSQARIDTSGDSGGLLMLRAGTATLTNSHLGADNLGDQAPLGGLDLSVSQDFTLAATRAQSNAWASGDSGGIRVQAGTLTLAQAGAEIFTGLLTEVEPQASGHAGDLAVTVRELLRMEGAVGVTSTTWGAGNSGAVQVTAGSLLMDGQGVSLPNRTRTWIAGISSEATVGSTGHANDVGIDVAGRFEIQNSGGVSSSTLAAGDAGSLTIRAGALLADGERVWLSGVAAEGAQGRGGSLDITTRGSLELRNGAGIYGYTYSPGAAGDIKVTTGGSLILADGARIIGSTMGAGQAGKVTVTVAEQIEVLRGAQISNNTFASGNAGDVTVTAGAARFDTEGLEGQFTGLASQANPGSSGTAGTITLTVAGLLEVLRGAQISNNTFASGNAGDVTVTAGAARFDTEGLEGQVTGLFSNANSGSSGAAGTVTLSVEGLLEVLRGAQISSSSFASGNAGEVTVTAGTARFDTEGMEGQFTGLFSNANRGSSGGAGTVTLSVAGLLEVLRGAEISSGTFASGDAGDVTVTAGTARFDAEGVEGLFTGLSSSANSGSSGAAGTVTLSVAGLLEVLRGAEISSGTFASGDAGDVTVTAGTARFDAEGVEGQFTGLFSHAASSSSGATGTVTLTVAGLLEVLRGAAISSTSASGDAGNITVTAGAARFDNDGVEGQVTGLFSHAASSSSGATGTVTLTVAGLLEVLRGAAISSMTSASGDAGNITVTAGAARFDNEGMEGQVTGLASIAASSSSGATGTVTLTVAGLLEVLRGAAISSSTFASGDAGDITVTAGAARFDNDGVEGQVTGLFSNAIRGSSGAAGTVTLTVAGLLEVLRGAAISSMTSASGDAGNITVTAGVARFDNKGVENQLTGLTSSATPGSNGTSGTVTLTVAGLLEILRGAKIISGSFASGDAGEVTVTAGTARFDGGVEGQVTGLFSNANRGSSGTAGTVTLTVAGLLEVLRGAAIGSSTFASGDAGDVTVTAGAARFDGGVEGQVTGLASSAETGSSGSAGTVTLTVAGLLEVLRGAQISSSTFASGDAGEVAVTAGAARFDGGVEGQVTGLSSDANSGASGAAGTVTLSVVGLLEVLRGALISSSTDASGSAGDINVNAGRMHVQDGVIGSAAGSQATGLAGRVNVAADWMQLDTNSLISIASLNPDASPPTTDGDPTRESPSLRIQAGTLLMNDSEIGAQSAGSVPAAPIVLQVGKLHLANNSRISTASQQADAGTIGFDGGVLWVQNSQITTSAEGDGGTIRLNPKQLVLESGFIQANAASGNGGDILITPEALLYPATQILTVGGDERLFLLSDMLDKIFDNLFDLLFNVGGTERFSFDPNSPVNIIQAVAPEGVSGQIELTEVPLDITTALVPLRVPFQDPDAIFSDLCQLSGTREASALIEQGTGGLPLGVDQPAATTLGDERLRRLLGEQ